MPITITTRKIERLNGSRDIDPTRAYIIAEFRDFIFISTHCSYDLKDRQKMVDLILTEDFIVNYRKPVYIAGDLNEEPFNISTQYFADNNFVILNDMTRTKSKSKKDPNKDVYAHATTHATDESFESMIDLILEYNKNPNRKTIDRGIPPGADRTFTISDHLPYYVKVKIK